MMVVAGEPSYNNGVSGHQDNQEKGNNCQHNASNLAPANTHAQWRLRTERKKQSTNNTQSFYAASLKPPFCFYSLYM
jgi:hypothetical protein